MVWIILLLLSFTGIGLAAYGVFSRNSNLFAASFWRGTGNRATIALTFDDGPSESTPEILRILRPYRIKATFFQCGANVRRLPEIARQVSAEGHEVGNHTESHPRLCFKSSAFINRELASAQEAIQQATGVPPKFFRAPFGLRWYGLGRVQRRLGLTGVLWSAIGFDWSRPAEQVVALLSEQACNGAIFCLHDGRRTTANPDITSTIKALEALIPILLERGFQFETVGQMLERGNPLLQSEHASVSG